MPSTELPTIHGLEIWLCGSRAEIDAARADLKHHFRIVYESPWKRALTLGEPRFRLYLRLAQRLARAEPAA